jgi:mono/diheme cytochrome c family protein
MAKRITAIMAKPIISIDGFILQARAFYATLHNKAAEFRKQTVNAGKDLPVGPTAINLGHYRILPIEVIEFVFGSRFSRSAIPEPEKLETIIAARRRRFLVRRGSSRETISASPLNLQAGIDEGDKPFGTDCADCHGLDGHSPTDAGRWMYPRASDLTSPRVQGYSDRELFWIVKNGIRFSGMPAFGKVETDEHIWNLVQYLRTLSRFQTLVDVVCASPTRQS